MWRTRTTKTGSGATAVQVVEYRHRQRVVIKHIGSAHNPEDIPRLLRAAQEWIRSQSRQLSLFPMDSSDRRPGRVLSVNRCQLLKSGSVFVWEVLNLLAGFIGFNRLTGLDSGQLLLDLTLARLIRPGSKLETLALLHDDFGITYQRSDVYRRLARIASLKDRVERMVIAFAKRWLNFNFSLVFYDVTTLYFESDAGDEELKRPGFSKDNKFHQPQLVMGLVVNQDGFPISHELFPGNKFEGHTIIPLILNLKQKYGIGDLTVVADAAMISQDNVDRLIAGGLHYIVGARLGSLGRKTIADISQRLNRQDDSTLRLSTVRGELVCGFSSRRYAKDKRDTEKQLKKAKQLLSRPDKAVKRLKFITGAKTKPVINYPLVRKAKLLWGIKGYYTDQVAMTDEDIITRYRNLWQVEKSFRITKSDLKARPIYHRQTEAIKSHLLICFMALAIAKLVELKTGLSIKKVMKTLMSVIDAKILDELTDNIITLRSKITPDVENIMDKLSLSH